MEVAFDNIRQAEGITDDILPLKEKLEKKFNLSRQVGNEKNVILTWNKVMRTCLIASLSLSEQRNIDDLDKIQPETASALCPVSLPKTITARSFPLF